MTERACPTAETRASRFRAPPHRGQSDAGPGGGYSDSAGDRRVVVAAAADAVHTPVSASETAGCGDRSGRTRDSRATHSGLQIASPGRLTTRSPLPASRYECRPLHSPETRNGRRPAGTVARRGPPDPSSVVTGVGSPPPAATRDRLPRTRPNRITPSSFHVPPVPMATGTTSRDGWPVGSTILSSSSVKKPIERPSGDQNGNLAPVVSGSPCAMTESTEPAGRQRRPTGSWSRAARTKDGGVGIPPHPPAVVRDRRHRVPRS